MFVFLKDKGEMGYMKGIRGLGKIVGAFVLVAVLAIGQAGAYTLEPVVQEDLYAEDRKSVV